MAFKTFTAGSVLTAADVNDYLMKQAVISCTSGTRPGTPNEGMTIYETDTDRLQVYDGSAWSEIGIGSTSLPRCAASRGTAQSIAHGSGNVLVSWTSEIYDVGGMFSPTSTTLGTIPSGRGGLYLISATIQFETNSTGYRALYVNVGGSTRVRHTSNAISGNPTRLTVTTIQAATAGQAITIGVFQNSGDPLDITSSEGMPIGSIHYLSPTP